MANKMKLTLTVDMLRALNACEDQIALFEKLFPSGAVVNVENVLRAERQGLNVEWLVRQSPQMRAAYEEASAPARAVYEEACAPAQTAFDEALAQAWAAYDEARAPAWADLEEALAQACQALAAYNEARAQAQTAFAKALAPAWAALKEARAQAQATFDEALAPARAAYADARAPILARVIVEHWGDLVLAAIEVDCGCRKKLSKERTDVLAT